jgi:hypothetical protein
MDSEGEPTYALTLTLTASEAKGLWSTAGQLLEDRSRIYALFTEGIPKKELREPEVDAFLNERLQGAHSGFQKLFDAILERFGPDVQLGPHRLA